MFVFMFVGCTVMAWLGFQIVESEWANWPIHPLTDYPGVTTKDIAFAIYWIVAIVAALLISAVVSGTRKLNA